MHQHVVPVLVDLHRPHSAKLTSKRNGVAAYTSSAICQDYARHGLYGKQDRAHHPNDVGHGIGYLLWGAAV